MSSSRNFPHTFRHSRLIYAPLMQQKSSKQKIITFGPELRDDFFLAPPPPEVQLEGRLPTPPASPETQHQQAYWRETVLFWNRSDFRWTLVEYVPCLLALIWEEEAVGPIEGLASFPSEAQYYFVKNSDAEVLANSGAFSRKSYQNIFVDNSYNGVDSSFRARHLRRFSEPDIMGARHSDPNGITQTSWLFSRFLKQVLKSTTISCTTIILALKFAQQYCRKRPAHDHENRFRLFVTCLMLANKYTEDSPYTNVTWSVMSGLPLIHINEMECEVLALFGHHLFVSESEFRVWTEQLQSLCQWSTPSAEYFQLMQRSRHFRETTRMSTNIFETTIEKTRTFWSRFKFLRR